VRGCAQVNGHDVYDTYALTLEKESLRLEICRSCQFYLKIHLFDVISAYLKRDIDKTVHIKLLGLLLKQHLKLSNVGLLKKALYKLKQAQMLWS
jgi:Reverse transcriptase (RNA-dependent DNA polymerase)